MYPMSNKPSAFVGCPIPDAHPHYVGCYLDEVAYFSESDQVEQWFKVGLSSHLRVEFMGPISYYLGIYFWWFMDKEDELAVQISQSN